MLPAEPDLLETRAALAPTLEATVAILPWLAKPTKPRFSEEQLQRWQLQWKCLATVWSERYGTGLTTLRAIVFDFYALALELGDTDCLRLAEALACVADRLDKEAPFENSRLSAALSATVECFSNPGSLEHMAFPQRAQHFAQRLEASASPHSIFSSAPIHTPNLNRIFVGEAEEYLERIHETLAVFPPDTCGALAAAQELYWLAEGLEFDEISQLAKELVHLLTPREGAVIDLDEEVTRTTALNLISKLEVAVAAVSSF